MITEEWVKFVCDNCLTKVKIQTKYSGKRGKCPKCLKRHVIPENGGDVFDIDADLLAEFADIDKDIEKKKKKSETQKIEHNWESGTKINMKELGFEN